MNPGFLRDLVRHTKAHSWNIIRHLVRVALKNCIDLRPVCLIDFHSQIQGNAVLLQKKHGLTQIPLLRHLRRNLPGAILTDSANLCQPLRFLINDTHGIPLELLYDPGSQRRSDPLHRTGTEVALDGDHILRSCHLVAAHNQLLAVYRVRRKFALGLQRLALAHHRHRTDQRKGTAVRRQLQHGITILLIPVNNMLYISG